MLQCLVAVSVSKSAAQRAALLGLLYLISTTGQVRSLHLHLLAPGSLRQDLTGVDLLGISRLSIGVFLLIISVGLSLRSKFAWLLSVLALAIVLTTLFVHFGKASRSLVALYLLSSSVHT